MPGREVFVCGGKKCARACAHNALIRGLCKRSEVRIIRCQKICNGSVVVAQLDDTLEWFEGIDSAKSSVRMRKVIERGSRKKLPPALKKRRVKPMKGRLPR